MGFFNIFDKNQRSSGRGLDINSSSPSGTSTPISVFHPKEYSEVELIIDALKEGKTAMVHLNTLKDGTAKRVIDILAGAIYALNGGVYEIEPNSNIYMYSPSGVIVSEK